MIVALPLLSRSPLLLLLFYFLTGILYYAPWSLEPLQGRRIRSTLFLGKRSLFFYPVDVIGDKNRCTGHGFLA